MDDDDDGGGRGLGSGIEDETDLLNFVTFDIEQAHAIARMRPNQHEIDELEMAFGGVGRPAAHDLPLDEFDQPQYRSHRRTRHARTRIHENLVTPLVRHPTCTLIFLYVRHFFWRLYLIVSGVFLLPVFFILASIYFLVGFPVLSTFFVFKTSCAPDACSLAIEQYRAHFYALICFPSSLLALAFSKELV